MENTVLSLKDEGNILITVAFLENGDILRSGATGLQCFELDLIVSEDVTCDQFLGAVYSGLRDVLIQRYYLDLTKPISSHGYRKERYTPRPLRKMQEETGKLRPKLSQELRLRTYALRQEIRSRKLAAMEEKIQFDHQVKTLSSFEMEKIGWVVCWQVFHECYAGYCGSYRNMDARTIPGKSKWGVVARCSPGGGSTEPGCNRLQAKPVVWLNRNAHGNRSLRQLGFGTGARLVFDPILMRGSPATLEQILWQPKKADTAQQPEQQVRELARIQVDAPSVPDGASCETFIPAVLTPLICTSSMIGVWIATGATMQLENLVWSMGAMIGAATVVSLINGGTKSVKQKKAVKAYLQDYQQYIRRTIDTIRQNQHADSYDKYRHPPVWAAERQDSLLYRLVAREDQVVGSLPGNGDFLWARLGRTVAGSKLVPSPVEIQGSAAPVFFSEYKYVNLKPTREAPFCITKEQVGEHQSWGYLKDLPEDLAATYGYVEDAPVGWNLQEHSILGFIMKDRRKSHRPLLDNLLIHLCANHGPEQLQVVWFMEECSDWQQMHKHMQLYKYLPHGRLLFGNRSQIVFNKNDGLRVLDMLQKLYDENHSGFPHVLVIFETLYDLEEHPFLSGLTSRKGVTCLFCCRKAQQVPKQATSVVECDGDGQWFLLTGNGDERTEQRNGMAHRFQPDRLHDDQELLPYRTSFTKISAGYDRQRKSGNFVDTFSLFQLLVDHCGDQGLPQPQLYADKTDQTGQLLRLRRQLCDYICSCRNGYVVGKNLFDTMAVPFAESRDAVVCLDLHEQSEGPHLLISYENAGAKNKVLITYLLNLCTCFGQDVLDVVLLSPFSTAALGLLKTVPAVTLLQPKAGEEPEVLATRMLQVLEEEMEKRKQKLARAKVSSVDEYNRLVYRLQHQPKSMERWLRKTSLPDPQELEMLLHHVVVLDEFQTLRTMDDGVAQLIQNAHGLGIHLILTAEKGQVPLPDSITGVFTACLELDKADAGSITGLLSSNRHLRKKVRVADSEESVVYRPCPPFRVTLANTQGFYSNFFDSESYEPGQIPEPPARPALAPQPEPTTPEPQQPDSSLPTSITDKRERERNLPVPDPMPGKPKQKRSLPLPDPVPGKVKRKRNFPLPDLMPRKLRQKRSVPQPNTASRKPAANPQQRSLATRYHLADEVFYRPQSIGLTQGEFVAQLLAEYKE